MFARNSCAHGNRHEFVCAITGGTEKIAEKKFAENPKKILQDSKTAKWPPYLCTSEFEASENHFLGREIYFSRQKEKRASELYSCKEHSSASLAGVRPDISQSGRREDSKET